MTLKNAVILQVDKPKAELTEQDRLDIDARVDEYWEKNDLDVVVIDSDRVFIGQNPRSHQ